MIIYVDFVYTERIYRKKEVANEDIEYETEYPNRFLGRKKKKKKFCSLVCHVEHDRRPGNVITKNSKDKT